MNLFMIFLRLVMKENIKFVQPIVNYVKHKM